MAPLLSGETICAVLDQCFIRNNFGNYFEFGPTVQEMSFKYISYLDLWKPFCSVERNHLCNLSKGQHEEQLCEIL